MTEYQILKATSCVVGRHVWHWSGSSTNPNSEPNPFSRCDCGRYLWAEARDIREAVELPSKAEKSEADPAAG